MAILGFDVGTVVQECLQSNMNVIATTFKKPRCALKFEQDGVGENCTVLLYAG